MNRYALSKAFVRVLALLTLPLVIGCGKGKITVTGTVSLDGKPVQKGFVSFQPEDGTGEAAGGQIANGEYKVAMLPGKKKVKVTVHQSIDEFEGDAKEERKRRTKEMQKVIKTQTQPRGAPPELIGNNEVHEISEDTTTLNIKLESPNPKR